MIKYFFAALLMLASSAMGAERARLAAKAGPAKANACLLYGQSRRAAHAQSQPRRSADVLA